MGLIGFRVGFCGDSKFLSSGDSWDLGGFAGCRGFWMGVTGVLKPACFGRVVGAGFSGAAVGYRIDWGLNNSYRVWLLFIA